MCSKNAALYTYNASFMKTMEYAMPVTQFDAGVHFSRVQHNLVETP